MKMTMQPVLRHDAREFAQRLAHEPRHDADAALAHLALQLAARQQGRDRVDDDDVQRARAHQLLGYLQRLLAGVRLGDEEVVYVHAQGAGVGGLQRVLDVYIRRLAAAFLGGGHDVQRQRRLAAALGAVDLDYAPARHAAYAEREVQGERARRDGLDIHGYVVPQAHDGALAVVLLYLGDGRLQGLFLVARGAGRRGGRRLFLFCHVTPR